MRIETIIERDYAYRAAGRVWRIPELRLDRLPDGEVGLPLAEIRRVNRGIANQVCGEATGLTVEEFEFLCNVTEATYSDVAREVGVSPSTLTKWRGRGERMEKLRSTHLKKWFWFRLFGDALGDQRVDLKLVRSDAQILESVRSAAVESDLADVFQEEVA